MSCLLMWDEMRWGVVILINNKKSRKRMARFSLFRPLREEKKDTEENKYYRGRKIPAITTKNTVQKYHGDRTGRANGEKLPRNRIKYIDVDIDTRRNNSGDWFEFDKENVIYWLIDWLIDWLTDWLIDWLIDWLSDWLTEWLIDWLIDGLIDWFSSTQNSEVTGK